jgi:hypothetical protein
MACYVDSFTFFFILNHYTSSALSHLQMFVIFPIHISMHKLFASVPISYQICVKFCLVWFIILKYFVNQYLSLLYTSIEFLYRLINKVNLKILRCCSSQSFCLGGGIGMTTVFSSPPTSGLLLMELL